uniref:Uncharacterized protein n=1 Tax=Tetraselmis sp. GSL018 TaxID=582737 RepID=A0A061RLZ3_9CHLO
MQFVTSRVVQSSHNRTRSTERESGLLADSGILKVGGVAIQNGDPFRLVLFE